MQTYQLYPGLKAILEDKSLRGGSVPSEEQNAYRRAEQFVIDSRFYSPSETEDMVATYADLKEMGLEKPPCSRLVLHEIINPVPALPPQIISYYFNGSQVYFLTDNMADWREAVKQKNGLEKAAAIAGARLVVMLATKGSQKERHDVPKVRRLTNPNHPKGTGGYTIISAPLASLFNSYGVGAAKRPHFRRGHIRKYHPEDKTQWVWVSSCFVHSEPEVQRKAYLMDAA